MHFYILFLFEISCKDSIYDILKQYEHCKTIAWKKINLKGYELLNGLKWAIFSYIHYKFLMISKTNS